MITICDTVIFVAASRSLRRVLEFASVLPVEMVSRRSIFPGELRQSGRRASLGSESRMLTNLVRKVEGILPVGWAFRWIA